MELAILICTFNPYEKSFSRTLNALRSQELGGMKVECIIVDNNSSVAVSAVDYVQDFLKCCPWAKVVKEERQGLKYARITAVQSCSAQRLVFLDDDNELDADYLQSAFALLQRYPGVAAWGPGKVRVEFLEPVSPWFDRHCSPYFQARDTQETVYGCVPESWTDFYPFGTGLVLRRQVFDRYLQAVESDQLTLVDREGGNLSSAGDIQIVWEAIKLGFSAGVSPTLRLNHLIPEQRSNLFYIKRLVFGTASSYVPALVESFPATQDKVLKVPSNLRLFLGLIKRILFRIFNPRLIVVEIASYLGHYVGILRVSHSDQHQWIDCWVKILNLK